ncbi:MAG: cytochrome c [Hyphomicrobiales bacterium]
MIKKLQAKAMPLLVAAVLIGGVVIMFTGGKSKGFVVDVKVPNLSAVALEGEQLFNSTCARCHGNNAAGTDKGPPFVYTIYNPGHHGDIAFVLAAKNGVRAHHWRYGNMPALGTPEADVLKIVRYVRELQRANGIVTKPHNM